MIILQNKEQIGVLQNRKQPQKTLKSICCFSRRKIDPANFTLSQDPVMLFAYLD